MYLQLSYFFCKIPPSNYSYFDLNDLKQEIPRYSHQIMQSFGYDISAVIKVSLRVRINLPLVGATLPYRYSTL